MTLNPVVAGRSLVAVAVLVSACTGKYIRETTTEKIELTPERVARGKYLVDTVGACGGCHTSREGGDLMKPEDPDRLLGGGNVLVDRGVGLYMPNISGDVETGLGGWSDDEIMRAIRDGIAKDGHFLFPIMPFGSYQHISDDDTRAIVAYLRTVPAVKPVLPRQPITLPFPTGFFLNTLGVALHAPAKDVKPPNSADRVAYGKYIARLGHCGECHSFGGQGPRAETDRYMAGSDTPFEMPGVGKVWAANLTSDAETGLGKYSADQIKAAIRSGKRLDGKQMAPPMSLLIPHFALTEEKDLDALVQYVASLPAVKNPVPARVLDPAYAKLVGE